MNKVFSSVALIVALMIAVVVPLAGCSATYTLTMAVNGNGSVEPAVGDHSYSGNEAVKIVATPDEGWKFVNWTGDVADPNSATTTVTMNGNKEVTANFEQVALTIVNGDKSKELTLSEIKAMNSYEGWGGKVRSTGEIEPPTQCKGVPLKDLLDLVGGITESDGVKVSAKDGYSMTLSYSQITEGDFDAYNAATGEPITVSPGELKAILVYEENGEPLTSQHGPLELGVVNSQSQVTDGHWWVKWIEKIEVVPVAPAWTLRLEGALTEDMSPDTFESGAAPGCHGVTWVDGDKTWGGIPLWLLIGRVDDEVKHESGAFNDQLAKDPGYTVRVIAKPAEGESEPYYYDFSSSDIARNNDIIVANTLNGKPISEEDGGPLRLVGSGLTSGGQKVKQIDTIKLILPSETP